MRALISVTDKTGLVSFAKALAVAGWELVATGGSAKYLAKSDLSVIETSDLTGYPAILDGRVKTLHPAIFGGILADMHNQAHIADLARHEITAFDLVICNLYDFPSNPAVENIDIGGPAMVRAAAKNYNSTAIVVDPADYSWVLAQLLEAGSLSLDARLHLAAKAFQLSASYDSQIASWFGSQDPSPSSAAPGAETDETLLEKPGETAPALPETLQLSLRRTHRLRYGENPTQLAARYEFVPEQKNQAGHSDPNWFEAAVLHNGSEATGGKGLSYLNLLDLDAAWQLASALGQTGSRSAAVAVKHTNPCGVALADDIVSAWKQAFSCDPVSVFGGVVALSQPVSPDLAKLLTEIFLEVIVAPGYQAGALDVFRGKRNLRVLEVSGFEPPELDIRTAAAGLLVQTPAVSQQMTEASWEVVTHRSPTRAEAAELTFAWDVVAATQSNAVVIAKDNRAIGVGAGQQNRKAAVALAVRQASDYSGGLLAGSVCASDAFFPFRDGLELAAQAGCSAVIQPGWFSQGSRSHRRCQRA